MNKFLKLIAIILVFNIVGCSPPVYEYSPVEEYSSYHENSEHIAYKINLEPNTKFVQLQKVNVNNQACMIDYVCKPMLPDDIAETYTYYEINTEGIFREIKIIETKTN